jgi:hypothetical protein
MAPMATADEVGEHLAPEATPTFNGMTGNLNNGFTHDHINGNAARHNTPFSNGHSRPNGAYGNHSAHTNGNHVDQNVGSLSQEAGDGMDQKIPRPCNEATPIAIVGMSCRLPGNVASPADFWELCARSRSGYSEIPRERFNTASFHHPNPGKAGCHNPVGGHFLNTNLAEFDAPFFSLTEKEAISMDPQQRLLLECTFEALENAGIPKQNIVGTNVGVFVGGSFPEYESHLFRDTDTIPMHQATGTSCSPKRSIYTNVTRLRICNAIE